MLGPPIPGERCALATPTIDTVLLFPKWIQDERVRRYMNIVHPPSDQDEQDFFARNAADPASVIWAITVTTDAGPRAIGTTGLHGIDWPNRHATSGVIIGDPDYWGRGIGGEVMRLRTRYAFEELGLEKVMTEIMMENEASRRAALAAGYREVGVRRRHKWRAGRWHDMWLAEVLRDDWLTTQSP